MIKKNFIAHKNTRYCVSYDITFTPLSKVGFFLLKLHVYITYSVYKYGDWRTLDIINDLSWHINILIKQVCMYISCFSFQIEGF